MIEILSVFTVKALNKLFETVWTYGSNRLTVRRSVLANLIFLYDKIDKVLNNSIHIQEEFQKYADGTEAATITVPTKLLTTLRDDFLELVDALNSVGKVIEIYDIDLSISVSDRCGKGAIWKQLDVTEMIVPTMANDNGGRRTFKVRYPTKLPLDSNNNHRMIIDPNVNETLIDERLDCALRDLENDYGYVEVDLRINGELEPMLRDNERAIDSLSAARGQLSQLIRENFSLDQVFEAQ